MICLSAGTLAATLATTQFTLAWVHSIEKTRWEEDWHLVAGRLEVAEARIEGVGAGMEPPPGARLERGTWRYVPARPGPVEAAPLGQLALAHSPYAAPYTLCAVGRCAPLADWLPGLPDTATVRVAPCP